MTKLGNPIKHVRCNAMERMPLDVYEIHLGSTNPENETSDNKTSGLTNFGRMKFGFRILKSHENVIIVNTNTIYKTCIVSSVSGNSVTYFNGETDILLYNRLTLIFPQIYDRQSYQTLWVDLYL